MTIKRIQVKETQKYYGDFDGTLEDIISSLQSELDAGWAGLESEYEWDYDGEKYIEYYLYKHREENDKEYEKRMKQLEKEKAEKAKAKERKLKQLKKDLASLTDDELKQLGIK
jgi:spore germination cell wall hydrolase CwlJ-like protein